MHLVQRFRCAALLTYSNLFPIHTHVMNEAKGIVPGYPESMRKILGTNIAEVHGAMHKRIRGSLLSLIGPIAVKDRLLPEVDEFMRSP
ncbi:hypothetical protein JHK86_000628 [Glycine max]|nr:hypothetical protein JHK86_000628 [Glycine max]